MIFADLETYSEVPLKHGTYVYAENCEIMLFAWAIDDEPARVWDLTAGEPMPDRLRDALATHDVTFHNAQFDRTVLRLARNRIIDLPLERVHCTMARAYQHSLPGRLDALCGILNIPVDKRKLSQEKQLVQLFCKPRPKRTKIRRATSATHPAEWQRFCNYARLDVDACRSISRVLPLWNAGKTESALWILDQRVNDRGIRVDRELARRALDSLARIKSDYRADVAELTDGAVKSATKRDQLLAYLLEAFGVGLPDMKSATLERRIDDPELPEVVKELLRIRLQASMTAGTKYQSLLRGVSSDGRLRGTLQFCGAYRTGRWAGRVFQPQNLMRPPPYLKKQIDTAIDALMADGIDLLYELPMEVISSLVRSAIVAAPGRKLVVSDLSAIEGRVIAWHAGEQWKIDAFARGDDLYVLGYARSFHVTEDEVNADTAAGGTMRLIGKVQELALGFQGAVGAFKSMAALYGVELEESRVVEIVKAWRKANPSIVRFWYGLEDAALRAATNNGKTIEFERLRLRRDSAWLRIQLPSGRCLCYPGISVNESGKLSYMGTNQYTRQWSRITTYGGKLCENVVQATARDILAAALPRIESAGYPIVLTVHDEVLTEPVDRPEYSAKGLCALMTKPPIWAQGLPLAAEGFESQRYRKD